MPGKATGSGQSAIGAGGRKPTVDEVFGAVVAATAHRNPYERIDRRYMLVGRLRCSRRSIAARRVVIRLLRDLRGMSIAEASRELGYRSGSGPHNLNRERSEWERHVERHARDRLAHILTDCPLPVAHCPSSTEAA